MTNLVSNGGFETLGSTTLFANWLNSGNVGINSSTPYSGRIAARFGPITVGNPTISQVVTGLTPGLDYTLSYYAQGLVPNVMGSLVIVVFSPLSLLINGEIGLKYGNYTLYRDTFTADSTSVSLEFFLTNESFSTGTEIVSIDNVSITQGAYSYV